MFKAGCFLGSFLGQINISPVRYQRSCEIFPNSSWGDKIVSCIGCIGCIGHCFSGFYKERWCSLLYHLFRKQVNRHSIDDPNRQLEKDLRTSQRQGHFERMKGWMPIKVLYTYLRHLSLSQCLHIRNCPFIDEPILMACFFVCTEMSYVLGSKLPLVSWVFIYM